MSDLRQRLRAIHDELCDRFFEREAVIRGALAALLAGEHTLLLGPVGTAKSMLAIEICERLEGAQFFGWLLTRFSTPEELFGAVSLKGLEEDRYERVTTGKLPEAHIAFLDEIFKANSAILNSTLSIINERVFHNGQRPVPVPLISVLAASNELPEEGELTALFDRFMLRYTVDYIEEDFRFLKMLALPTDEAAAAPKTTLTLDQLMELQHAVDRVEIDGGTLADIVEIRSQLGRNGIVASDRRYRRAVRLLKAYALVGGRDTVAQVDLMELQHVLWSDPGHREEVRLTLSQVLHGHEEDARALLFQAREIRDYALRAWDDPELAMRAGIEAHTKLSRILAEAHHLVDKARARHRDTTTVIAIHAEIEGLQREILAEGV